MLYKPTAKFGSGTEDSPMASAKANEASKTPLRPERPGKKKQTEKKKSNMEMFKEELKAMQEEREERHRNRSLLRSGGGGSSSSSNSGGGGGGAGAGGGGGGGSNSSSTKDKESLIYGEGGGRETGSHDVGDPTTTNLYLGNLNPKLTEQQLMELFGKYGPLASIKIMWPRTEDEKSRGRHCGFVAFMCRKDGERALNALSGKQIEGELNFYWFTKNERKDKLNV